MVENIEYSLREGEDMDKMIKAKSILIRRKNPECWFYVKYGLNIYRGCSHGCIYCDSRSQCYGKEDFEVLEVKENAIELLENDLSKIRKKGILGVGSMSDPYLPKERKYRMTRKMMELAYKYNFPVHLITKSDIVIDDIDLYKKINEKSFANITFTITTSDDELVQKIEPNVTLSSKRLQAMKKLSDEGIYTGVALMPILPFINDNESNIKQLVKKSYEYGAKYIIASFGVTLRDIQRYYFYEQLDKHFPGIKGKYMNTFGNSYGCNSPNNKKLWSVFKNETEKYGLVIKMKELKHKNSKEDEQLSFF